MAKSWTPGRVNLIGEWVDFNGGWVLPAALPLGVAIEVTQIGGTRDIVGSAQFEGLAEAELDARASGHWADYVFGALQYARRKGWLTGGARAELSSDIPAGAGVSSSAAVTLGVLRALAPADTDATELAVLAREIENRFIGVPCGIMDQMAVAHTRPGEALALDTRTLSFQTIDLPSGWRFAVLHSGVQRKLADGRYKTRRTVCLEAADQLGQEWLCDAADLSALGPEHQAIARHVTSENRRALEAIRALEAGEAETFGRLMTASHISLRDDFDVSTPEIDRLVADFLAHGAPGARITGAGFGGCIVVLKPAGVGQDWVQPVLDKHPAALLVCEIGS